MSDIHIYRVPAKNGKPTIEIPNLGSHVKKWIIRFDGTIVEIHTDKEFKELEKYKI